MWKDWEMKMAEIRCPESGSEMEMRKTENIAMEDSINSDIGRVGENGEKEQQIEGIGDS